jgi:hypothetical protein
MSIIKIINFIELIPNIDEELTLALMVYALLLLLEPKSDEIVI